MISAVSPGCTAASPPVQLGRIGPQHEPVTPSTTCPQSSSGIAGTSRWRVATLSVGSTEHQLGAGVLDHPGAFLRGRRGIDRYDDSAGGEYGQSGTGPVRAWSRRGCRPGRRARHRKPRGPGRCRVRRYASSVNDCWSQPPPARYLQRGLGNRTAPPTRRAASATGAVMAPPGSSSSLPTVPRPRIASMRGAASRQRVRRRRRPVGATPSSRQPEQLRATARAIISGRLKQCPSQNAATVRDARHQPDRVDRLRRLSGRPDRTSPAGRTAPAARSDSSKTRPPTISSTTSTGRPPFASTSRSFRPSASRRRSRRPRRAPAPAPASRPTTRSRSPGRRRSAWPAGPRPSRPRRRPRGRRRTRPWPGGVDVCSRCQAVTPCRTSASACPSDNPSGMSKTSGSGASATCAYPPLGTRATTRRPSSVVPATSPPGTTGSCVGVRYVFSVWCVSA